MAFYKIDTGKLRQDADDLNQCKTKLFDTLKEIEAEVKKIPDVWVDQVAVDFMRKFDGLSNDFMSYDQILGEYSNKAIEIADEYDKANAEASNELGDLLSDL